MCCHGSFEPAEPEPSLSNAQDADGSETCSNRSDLGDCEAAQQSSDPDAPIEDQPPTTSDDLIIPDSQPDDSLPSCANQGVTALIAEAQRAGAEPADRHQGQATSSIPSSPLEFSAACSSRANYEQIRSSSCSTAAGACCSPDSSDQQQFVEQSALVASAASPSNSCEAVPDTELQTSPSSKSSKKHHQSIPAQLSIIEVPGTSSSYIVDRTSASGTSDLASQHAEQQSELSQLQQQKPQQQEEQQQVHQQLQPHVRQQQLQPPQSVCSSSAGSPGTSNASRAFVIEDSDSESDFQPLKPARPSTSSFHSSFHGSAQATCRPDGHHMLQPGGHHTLQLGKTGDSMVAPLKLMSRYPRGTTVKEHHGLGSLKGVQFAEQLQV